MQDTDRVSLDDFIAQHQITAVIDAGAPKGSKSLGRDMNPWTVTLVVPDGGTLVIPFFTGLALGEPEVRDVLECLALDSSTYENTGNLVDWAEELGFENIREAVETFQAVERQAQGLRMLLSTDVYEQLLWSVDVD